MPSDETRSIPPKTGGVCPSGHDTVESVLDAYLEELVAGRQPDQQTYVRNYPQLADTLRGVFKTLDFVEATSSSLRAGKLGQGSRLGDFQIIREVARGGMGVVYEAVQTSLNRRVALKVLPTAAMLSPTATERFTREAATTGQLHHTHIVPVYAVGEAEGVHYYAMQFIEGQSLSGFLKAIREKPTALDRDHYRRVARWGQQVADALAHVHNQDIIHRDIKPSNLLLDERDDVWISDFGLARVDAVASLTMTGDVVGTTRYMSPEQARGGHEHVDFRTDIYSLGATLYELLALSPAVGGASREEVLSCIAFSRTKPLRQVNPGVPRDLETIVGKCMEKEPGARYPQARDVAEDLRRFLDDAPIRARRTPKVVLAARFIRKHRVHAAGVLLAAILLIATVVLTRQVRLAEGARLLEKGYAAILFERNPTEAEVLLDDAEACGIDSTQLYIYRGLIPLLNNEPLRAIPFLEEGLKRDPDSVEATLGLGLARAATGDFLNAQQQLARFGPDEIKTALAWYLRGLALSKTTRTEAINAYNQAIAVRADFTPAIEARAHYRGIRLLTESVPDQLDAMIDDFNALVVFRPNDAGAHCARARGLLFAAAHAARTPQLSARNPQWLEGARSDLETAMRLKRADDSLVWIRKGVYERYLGEFGNAADAFEEAIAIDRQAGRRPHPYRIHELATARYALGEFEEALQLIEPVTQSAPGYCPLVLQQALLLAELNRPDEARATIRTCIEQQRTNANGLFLSVVTAELLGESEAAREAVETFIDSSRDHTAPSSSDAPTELVSAYLAGNIDAASLRASVGNAPGRRCEVEYLIALRALASGDRATGRAALEQCVQTEVFIFTEYRLAQSMLARMDAQPDWPQWID